MSWMAPPADVKKPRYKYRKNKNRGCRPLHIWKDAKKLSRMTAWMFRNLPFESGLITKDQHEDWDKLAFKMENGLLKRIESLQRKRNDGSSNDSLIVEESNVTYE